MPTNLRSVRVSDDIWNELTRLRLPEDGFGEQKTWDALFNYFLIVHHSDLNWKKKVKEVDLEIQEKTKEYYKKLKQEETDGNKRKQSEIE